MPITLEAEGARDMMTATPVAIYETTSLRDAAQELVRFSAVPVIDADRRVVGVLSRTDLARSVKDDKPTAELDLEGDAERPSGIEYHPQRRVIDAMNRDFYSVRLDATAAEVVRLMVDRSIGRVFVV
ncbi:MAG: CBS domain-containing protein, partial [Phycisphaeraceae bacterium]|nr:CBS domain-containing protein [Phycisphaeraceae bacterium]